MNILILAYFRMKTVKQNNIIIVASKLGRRNFQVILKPCPQVMTAPNVSIFRLSLLSLYCCLCVATVALPPEKTDSCCVEEKTKERDSQSPAGPKKQLQFEVSVDTKKDILTLWMKLGHREHTHTNAHTHIHGDTDRFVLCCSRSWSVPCLWRRITGRSGHLLCTTLTTTAKSPER